MSRWNTACSYVITSTDCYPKCRFRTAPPPIVTSSFQNWKKLMKGWKFADNDDVAGWTTGGPKSRILLQQNKGFGESLDQVHFCRRELRLDWIEQGLTSPPTGNYELKSDKVSCTYSVVNSIRGYELFERHSYTGSNCKCKPTTTRISKLVSLLLLLLSWRARASQLLLADMLTFC